MGTDRSRKSILNSVSGLIRTFAISVAGLIATKVYLTYLGSDFNGVMSAATQMMTALMVLEGGFTIASNVALYAPFEKKDYTTANAILSATKIRFDRVALITLVLGVIVSFAYGLIIDSGLDRAIIIGIFLVTVFTTAANFSVSMKYRVVLQTDQKEYVISNITTLTTVVGYGLIILSTVLFRSMWMVSVLTLAYSLASYLVIAWYAKKKYPFIDFGVTPDYSKISGTRDVFVQKVTSVLYSSAPILVISLISTTMASIYAVYNMVFNVVKNVISVFSQAPRLSFGSLLSQEDRDMNKVRDYLLIYELIVVMMTTVCIVLANSLIIPFMKLYLSNVSDADYIHAGYAVLFGLVTFFSSIHIPAGQIILMSGNFRISKIIQIAAAVVLVVLIPLLAYQFQITGALIAMLIAALVLAVLEICYIHGKYIPNDMKNISICIGANFAIMILQVFIYTLLLPQDYISITVFILEAAIIGICAVAITVGVNFLLFKKQMLAIFNIVKRYAMLYLKK